MENDKKNTESKESKEALLTKAKRYQRIHLKLSISKAILWAVVLLIFLFSGASSELRNTAESIYHNSWLVVLLYIAGLNFITEILFLPFSYYGGFILEHRFGLSTESFLSWIKDALKSFAISLVFTIILVEALYFLLREVVRWWWLIAALGFTLFFVLMAKLAPVILFPLFFKFKSLEDEELKERLLRLTNKVGVKVVDIKEMDLSKKSKTANAALAGWGGSRRIILSDTLLAKYSKDEIETILAHELGHFVHKDLWKGIVLQSCFSLIGFYLLYLLLGRFVQYFNFRSISDIASFPILMLTFMLLGFILMPLANAYSRHHEKRADRFALKKTNKPQDFISAMEKLAEQNLADTQPHPFIEFLFYSHPSISKRIKIAQMFSQQSDNFYINPD